jgi:hypothetical protein
MGVWGTGLYSGDLAIDLRSAIRAIARLPFDGDRLLEIVCELEPSAAQDERDEEHTTFWLVVADQFAKRGIPSTVACEKAMTIIDRDSDLAKLAALGMAFSDLTKRKMVLNDLRTRLADSPTRSAPRRSLKRPQSYIMEVGDVLVYPTGNGKCRNPYARSKDAIPGGWTPDGWNLMTIVDRGRAFDFLVWYRPLILTTWLSTKPSFAGTSQLTNWRLRAPGTCSAQHWKRMGMEKLGHVEINRASLMKFFPDMPSGLYAAINNISVAEQMDVNKESFRTARPDVTIPRLVTICESSS